MFTYFFDEDYHDGTLNVIRGLKFSFRKKKGEYSEIQRESSINLRVICLVCNIFIARNIASVILSVISVVRFAARRYPSFFFVSYEIPCKSPENRARRRARNYQHRDIQFFPSLSSYIAISGTEVIIMNIPLATRVQQHIE